MSTLRQWRERHGLTLEELSALSGVSVSELSRVERNLRQLAPLRRVHLARRLGVPLREIFPPVQG